MRRLVLLLVFVPGLACSGEEVTPKSPEASVPSVDKPSPPPKTPETETEVEVEVPPESSPPTEGFFMADGAPDPRTCAVASDCRGDTIPDLDNPCCQNPYSLEPYANAYQTWLNGWRREHCDAVTCPPPPAPSRPPDCAFELDCVDGRCVDTCP